MPNERAIICGDAPAKRNDHAAENVVRLRLGGPRGDIHLKSDDLSRPLTTDIPSTFSDLIEIATYVYCADQAVTRGGDGVENVGADWRRKFHFTIPVRNVGFWRKPDVMLALQETLSFLSEDEYHFEFCDLVKPPELQNYLAFSNNNAVAAPEEVVLFSGGIDSLGGAVQEIVVDKRRVVLVNHRSTEKFSRRHRHLRELLAQQAGMVLPIHVPIRINKKKSLGHEYTQRSRSFLYASLAGTIAQMYGLSRIRFYENGIVSLNLPLSPQVVGAKATRTTHPRVIDGFARILSLVADKPFAVQNPFLWKTKSEIVKLVTEAGCGELLKFSTSCTHTWELTNLRTHCGTCSQCIDRRFAVLAAGAEALDPAEAYGVDLLTQARDEGEPLTMLASYVETALEVMKLSATEFFGRYGEIGRVINHLDGSPDTSALKIFELYQRHSRQVGKVIDDAIAKNASAIRNRELPDSCLLRLVCDSSVPSSGTSSPPVIVSPPEPRLVLKEFAFRKKGQAWVVRYKGKDEKILLPSKGAAYLHLLLSNPSHALSAVEMAYQVARAPQKYILGNAGERSDKEAQAAYRARYQDLMDEKKKAEDNDDEATQNRVQGEIDALAKELKDHGWGGRPKKEHDDRDRVRKAVGNAIHRAIEQISEYDNDLAEHLKPPRLRCGNEPIYDPGTQIEWDL